jgi:hypothetical protein
MKCLVPVPPESIDHLKNDRETGFGYQAVAVKLKDGRFFEHAVASDGCIVEVRGHADVPFAAEEIQSVNVTHHKWNFRSVSDAMPRLARAKAATAQG